MYVFSPYIHVVIPHHNRFATTVIMAIIRYYNFFFFTDQKIIPFCHQNSLCWISEVKMFDDTKVFGVLIFLLMNSYDTKTMAGWKIWDFKALSTVFRYFVAMEK